MNPKQADRQNFSKNLGRYKMDLAGRELNIEINRLAQQANGSVLVTYGQTTVLATCTMTKESRDVDWLPLSVDYEEKLYAVGKIKSSRFLKREGRATDEAMITARMIDRVIRPCFNNKIRNSIHIVLTVLSFDQENDPDIPALIAASLALSISDIPFAGPVAGLRIGRSLVGEQSAKQEWVLNPVYKAREESDFDLIVAGKEDKINMLEGDAQQTSEDIILSAIEFVQPQLKKVIEFQEKIVKEVNPVKADLEIKETDLDLIKEMRDWLGDKLEKAIYKEDKTERLERLRLLENELILDLTKDLEESIAKDKKSQIKEAFDQEIDLIVHQNILKPADGKEKRPDGRKLDQVRPIKTQVSVLLRTHGSGLFNRGSTQALSVVTLGSPGDKQIFDNMEDAGTKRFIHHYNFPPFCVGETGSMFGPGRREIGHGALAEKALYPLIPDEENFPYTIRLVSEILSSNGSSSMASVSGSSLALMDAGVPIKEHISGLAMGLMMESDEHYKVLTDIQGPEDHYGDMDCKIAGTKKGMTACQMDVKIGGVTLEILKKVFEQSKKGRLTIIEEMEKTINEARKELSPFAPRILTIRINPDKIRNVIGPGGKIINEITSQTGAKIDINDDGLISITSTNEEGGQKALKWVNDLTREAKQGEIFQGKVVKITDFGAFVEILPGQDGLIHISELSNQHIKRVEDVLKFGQVISVKVKGVDESGRISLTLKDIKS